MRSVLAFAIIAGLAAPALAADGQPDWTPVATERLVKLPPAYLKKSLDRDFEKSALAEAMRRSADDMRAKAGTLGDLKSAIGQADGELAVELRHQYLAEKRAYIDLVAQHHAQRQRYLERRQAMLERLLDKATAEEAPLPASRAELAAQQEAARARFSTTRETVDLRVMRDQVAPESRYARVYADNLAAIEKLAQAIERHPMNADATPVAPGDRRALLRQMIADTEAERALLTQEDTILGFMAKLVALDAMGLAEEVAAQDEGRPAGAGADPARPADALQHFVDG